MPRETKRWAGTGAGAWRGARPRLRRRPCRARWRGVGVDVGEVVAVEIGDGQLAEHVVEDRGRVLDAVVAHDHAGGLEAGEGEGLHIFVERHAVLQAERDGDGEVVHHGAEGGAFLVHVDEDFAEAAVVIFAGAQVDLVAADDRPSGCSPCGGRAAFRARGGLLDDALDDLFGDLPARAASGVAASRVFDGVVLLVVLIGEERGVERLAELGAVAVERVGLERQAPGQHVGVPCSPRPSRRWAC